jgi:abortive infection bacteriophage resistance protein
MQFEDAHKAEHFLKHLNYYRLRAYWLPFEKDHTTHLFFEGTRFERVLQIYLFDRHLRLLIIEAIEQIEVSVRSSWAFQLAHNHGPHGHLDVQIARNVEHWRINFQKLSEEVRRSEELFVKHFLATYSEEMLPVWAACEVMSLGLLSRWYATLRPMKTRSAISAAYRLDEDVLQSWLHHLSVVRNYCAHHSRLWNRLFSVTPARPKSKSLLISGEWNPGSRSLYNTLLIVEHFLKEISPENLWRQKLTQLLREYEIEAGQLGFPSGWEERSYWKNSSQ